jgi:hypothetical protein
MVHPPYALSKYLNSGAGNEGRRGLFGWNAFRQTTALLVARAPGLYFSESALSMKLQGRVSNPLLQAPVHIEFACFFFIFLLVYVISV